MWLDRLAVEAHFIAMSEALLDPLGIYDHAALQIEFQAMIAYLEAGQPMYEFRDIWELYMELAEAGMTKQAERLFEYLPASLKEQIKG